MTTQVTSPPETVNSAPAKKIGGAVFWILGAAALAVATLLLFADLDRMMVGGLVVLLLILLMLLTVPIGFAMITASLIGLLALGGPRVVKATAESMVFDGIASWSLAVIPLFVLMGITLSRSGVTLKAYEAASIWFGRLPGGLAVGTTVAGAGLATTSGSTIGISMALGRMAIPEMLRAGYSPRLATGSVAMAGTLGQLIPPSVLLVIYAGIAETSVGSQLMAGAIPGALLALSFVLVITIWVLLKPSIAPRGDRSGITWSLRFGALFGTFPLLLVAVIVIGGLGLGIFTANEAAAWGALAALVIGLARLPKGHRNLSGALAFGRSVFMDTVSSVGGLFILIVGALMLGRTLTLSGLAKWLGEALVGMNLDRVTLLLLLVVVYLLLGMFLESLPMMLLTIPILQAPLEAIGVDMIWFGIFIVLMCEIGMVFPPIGLLTFIVHRCVQNPDINLGTKITQADVFKGIMPFVVAAIGISVLLIFVPDIVLWLPDLLQSLNRVGE